MRSYQIPPDPPAHPLIKLAGALLLLALLTVLLSCSPRMIDNSTARVEYRDRILRDSLYFRDSIYITERQHGDTVYLREYRDRLVWRDKEVHDTVAVEVHDTTTVEKPVPADLTWTQQAKLDSWWWLLAAALAFGGWTFRKPLASILKTFVKI